MQVGRRMAHWMGASTPVFAVQPLTQPMSSMVVHRPVHSADRAEAEIIAPAAQGSIEFSNHPPDWLPIGVPPGHLAEFLTDGAHLLLCLCPLTAAKDNEVIGINHPTRL